MQPFPTEPNKVLICYRRTNYKFAQKLVEQLKNRFGIDSFLDENLHKEGYEWRPVWKGQLRTQVDPRLAPGLGPTVIVIATEAAREKKQPKDIVVEEIWEALNPEPPVTDIPVVILRFGSDGWPILEARLLEKFAEPELSRAIDPADLMRRLHQPQSLPPDWVSATLGENEWLAICRPIVTNVRAYFLRTLSTERESTKAWCQMILERTLAGSDHDFLSIQPSRVTIDKAIQAFAASEDGHALAVVGSGGLGKTTQVARSVLTAIESNQSTFFPVLISNEELTRLDYSLRKRLGVTWASQTSPLSLSDEGLYWFRNKLCFITDSLERADEVTTTAGLLERLRGIAKLLITSRPEAWAAAKGALAVGDGETYTLEKISEREVENTLRLFGNKIPTRPYLCNPVFLDIAISLSREPELKFDAGLETETALLDRFKKLSIEPAPNQVRPEAEHQRKQLRQSLGLLAKSQIDLGKFNVPLRMFLDRQLDGAITYLDEKGKFVITEGFGPDKTVRLRHDVVDAHNIADLLRDDPSLIGEALAKLNLGFGEIVFEGIVETADNRKSKDKSSSRLLDTFFDEFLRLIDNKYRAELNAAAWNSGYVIVAKFHVFVDRIKKTLQGKYLGPVPKIEAPIRHSGIGDGRDGGSAGLTQQAMSSVASMLMSAKPLSVPDVDGKFIAALEGHINSTPHRGRLIEALAKIQRGGDVIALLERFVENETFIARDRGVAKYLAAALQDVARGDRSYAERVEAALQRLRSHFEQGHALASPVILRSIDDANEDIDRLLDRETRTTRPISREEIAEGLRNNEGDNRVGFSDWMTVERYLQQVWDTRGIIDGVLHADVVLAVGRVMWHHHLRCRERAVATLGAIDHSIARGLLLHVFTFEDEDGPIAEIVAALRRHAKYIATAEMGQRDRFRLALLRSLASRGRNRKRARFAEISEILDGLGGVGDSLITEGFVEMRRFGEELPSLVALGGVCSPDIPAWFTDDERGADVGEEREAKVAFQIVPASPVNEIGYIESSWRLPRRLHKALCKREQFFNEILVDKAHSGVSERPEWDIWKDRDSSEFAAHVEAIGQLYAAFESATDWPSIASVHAIVVTSDGEYIEAKRALDSDYSPGAWSASFEEQLKREDIDRGSTVLTCLLRGLAEEFGAEVSPREIRIGASSLGVEWAIGNLALLVYAVLQITSTEFVARADSRMSDKEISHFQLKPLLARLQSIEEMEGGYWIDLEDDGQHPTNAARLALTKLSRVRLTRK